MTAPNRKPDPTEPERMAAWLRANPQFLAENPDLYRILAPPARVHGEVMADHMAAMLRAERAHASAMAERADGVLAAGRARAGLTARVHEAVLALIAAAAAPGQWADCLTSHLPGVLALDSVALCVEGGRAAPLAWARALPPGAVARLLGGRDVVFRDAGEDPVAEDAPLLHGEAAMLARHDALVRVPLPGAPALLALSARERALLEPAQGAAALAFLGRAVAALCPTR